MTLLRTREPHALSWQPQVQYIEANINHVCLLAHDREVTTDNARVPGGACAWDGTAYNERHARPSI